MDGWRLSDNSKRATAEPKRATLRNVRKEIEETLLKYTRVDLELVLRDELKLDWLYGGSPSDSIWSKRNVVQGYIDGWELPSLARLGRRIVNELDADAAELAALLDSYDRQAGRAGVDRPAKNLIFAANGPKPELVLRDAINNDIEITRNAEFCLIYDRPIPADGLKFSHLVDWWRAGQGLGQDADERAVGRELHNRLRSSLGDNPAELTLLDTYARRYQSSFDVPALIPQVYLHYDPKTQRQRERAGQSPPPLLRQRMDFLLLFSDRHRVVLEVDGKQHYATEDGKASPSLYGEMVAEDRRLRLAGYEVYRFGGAELTSPSAAQLLAEFFDELAQRMS